MKKNTTINRGEGEDAGRGTLVGCRGAAGDAVESSARAGPFAKEFEAAAGPFTKELEVAAGPFAKEVVALVCREDGACAFVLPPTQRTGRAHLSYRWRLAARSTSWWHMGCGRVARSE